MWRSLLIFLPLVVAALEISRVFVGPLGHLICFVLIVAGLLAIFKWCKIPSWQRMLRSAVLSLGGALATFLLANQLQLGSLVASAVVGLIAARLFQSNDQLVIYLGAFVGMSSVVTFPTFAPLIVSGLLGGVFWELLEESWIGVGGRLGTIAATAVLVVLLVSGGGA